ncbi:MAG: hypothetical protein BECKG1743D_GA0114223_110821 [Candidatus Kentron sp. G]|nr:MAG: hypothetical protein BECKG1743D_GA0114223_110821 [Candidatus Kentron sp. G]
MNTDLVSILSTVKDPRTDRNQGNRMIISQIGNNIKTINLSIL